ncbi:MAG: hypothetical protein ACYCT0_04040 [Sulfobacillus sp.]
MTSRRSWRFLSILALGSFILTGCGATASPKSTPSKSTTPFTTSSSNPSPSASSPSPSSSSPSPTVAPATSSAPTTTESAPVPPGAGPYTDLGIHVTSVVNEGHATSSGASLSLYRIGLSVYNPTSSVVSLALNDFTVVVPGSTAYSWNDYATNGLSAGTSFFSYPIDASAPGSDVVHVFPDQTHTGEVTIQVPSASQYVLIWNTGATSPVPEATFKP